MIRHFCAKLITWSLWLWHLFKNMFVLQKMVKAPSWLHMETLKFFLLHKIQQWYVYFNSYIYRDICLQPVTPLICRQCLWQTYLIFIDFIICWLLWYSFNSIFVYFASCIQKLVKTAQHMETFKIFVRHKIEQRGTWSFLLVHLLWEMSSTNFTGTVAR